MTRQLLYVAHPVAPTDRELLDALPREAEEVGRDRWEASYPGDIARVSVRIARANLDRAMRWLDWLRRSFPETTFIAPWIASILAGADDGDPPQREAGVVDCCAVIERCDGIVLCGGRISSGMKREMDHGQEHHTGGGFTVFNLTPSTGYAEPSQIPLDLAPSAGQTLFSWIHRMVGYRMAEESRP